MPLPSSRVPSPVVALIDRNMATTSFLSMMEARMPPGFRFHPRDEELIFDYLMRRISSSGCQMMIDVDLNKIEPWDLPGEACVGGKEWYFYSLRDRKYATGQRTNRATVSGYWKATGKDRPVFDSRRSNEGAVLVGMRKTLVFYKGRAPKGKKTDWVMHEFRMESMQPQESLKPSSSSEEDWVLCRVFYKSRALSARPGASSAPPAATATTATVDNCYDDTAGTLVSIEQRRPPQQFNLQGYDDVQQVPCFSNLLLASSSAVPPRPGYQTLADFPPSTSLGQMVGLLPYLGSLPGDNKPAFASLHRAGTEGTSTGISFMNTDQNGVQQSMWNPC